MANPRSAHLNYLASRKLAGQLEHEIDWLERQISELHGTEEKLDFSLLQTYKEMIFSRKQMLTEIRGR